MELGQFFDRIMHPRASLRAVKLSGAMAVSAEPDPWDTPEGRLMRTQMQMDWLVHGFEKPYPFMTAAEQADNENNREEK